MKSIYRAVSMRVVLSGAIAMAVGSTAAHAEISDIIFEVEIPAFNFTTSVPVPLPLASDPVNLLGDSIDGYGFVNSMVHIKPSSSTPSQGMVIAFPLSKGPPTTPTGTDIIDPEALDGDLFFVDSFFDVFFDITVTDVDSRPGRDFAGQPDGVAVAYLDVGPFPFAGSGPPATFDKDAENFGLYPTIPSDNFAPRDSTPIEIPLGADINGNGENDKIKFTLIVIATPTGEITQVRLPDGSIVSEFDTGAVLEGAIVDESSDPPFAIGMFDPMTFFPDPTVFGGPISITTKLVNPVIPEPTGAAVMITLGGLAFLGRRRS